MSSKDHDKWSVQHEHRPGYGHAFPVRGDQSPIDLWSDVEMRTPRLFREVNGDDGIVWHLDPRLCLPLYFWWLTSLWYIASPYEGHHPGFHPATLSSRNVDEHTTLPAYFAELSILLHTSRLLCLMSSDAPRAPQQHASSTIHNPVWK